MSFEVIEGGLRIDRDPLKHIKGETPPNSNFDISKENLLAGCI